MPGSDRAEDGYLARRPLRLSLQKRNAIRRPCTTARVRTERNRGRSLRAEAFQPGLMNLPGELPPDDALSHFPGLDEQFEIRPGRDPHPVKHVDEVLRGHISGRTGGVGAP